MQKTSLEELIKTSVPFTRVNSSGWSEVICPCCNDYKPRGGFYFDDEVIIYNCFRGKCPIKSIVYTHGEPMSYKFRSVLDAFGIVPPLELLANRKQKKIVEIIDNNLFEEHHYNECKLPVECRRLDLSKDIRYKRYLEIREIDPFDEYYVADKGIHKNNIIIPFYFYKKLIGYQSLDINSGNYYKSEGNSDLIYFPNGKVPETPIIVEGVLDAKTIPNGIAVLQSTVSKKQAYFFRNKKPILLPDRKGSRFLDVAKKYNWKLCIPNWKEKDPNEFVKKYGRLVLAQKIREGIQDSLNKSELLLRLWCL